MTFGFDVKSPPHSVSLKASCLEHYIMSRMSPSWYDAQVVCTIEEGDTVNYHHAIQVQQTEFDGLTG